MKPKQKELVRVIWEDAYCNSGWTPDRVNTYKPLLIETIGRVFSVSKDHIAISPSSHVNSGETADTMYIPRKMIRKIYALHYT